jgi:hypothetical protein
MGRRMVMSERDEDAYAQLKFRVKERLRAALEQAARHRGVSMNVEIVLRLEESFDLGPFVDIAKGIVTAQGSLNAMTLNLNSLQHDALELVEGLRNSDCQEKALAIARKVSSIQEAMLVTTDVLMDSAYALFPLVTKEPQAKSPRRARASATERAPIRARFRILHKGQGEQKE